MGFVVRYVSLKAEPIRKRFEVKRYVEPNEENENSDGSGDSGGSSGNDGSQTSKEDRWVVGDGICFRSFSYKGGTNYVEIEGLNEPFEWPEKCKIFIEFDVTPMLQVTKAKLKCAPVGEEESWKSFPDMFLLEPEDDPNEPKKTLRTTPKVQKKAYLLIATRSDDDFSEFEIKKEKREKSESSESYFVPLQKCSTNVILMTSQVAGTPVVFPMPWYASLSSNDFF